MDKSELRRSLLQARAAIEPQRYQNSVAKWFSICKVFSRTVDSRLHGALLLAPETRTGFDSVVQDGKLSVGLPRCLPDHRLVWHYGKLNHP